MARRLGAAVLLSLSWPAAADITLRDAWVRALPPTQPTTAGYVTIANDGDEPVSLTGASASAAGRVEIHTTREEGGLVRMERLERLQIGPGVEVRLEPGGTHLMLMALERMPETGETVSLCLEFVPGGRLCTDAPVRRNGGAHGDHHHHHHEE